MPPNIISLFNSQYRLLSRTFCFLLSAFCFLRHMTSNINNMPDESRRLESYLVLYCCYASNPFLLINGLQTSRYVEMRKSEFRVA